MSTNAAPLPLRRLGEAGASYRDPLTAIDWRAAEESLSWLPPSLAPLDGIAPAQAPSSDFIRAFSRAEFARLCAAGLWLEGLLISRVAARGFLADRPDEAKVVLQEVREESGHGLMFLEMISRAGLAGVPLLGPKRLLTWVAHRLDPASAEFWAMVFVGESVTDVFAVRALKESDAGHAICPVARQVLALHHRDEARHIAAARTLLEARMADMRPGRRALFAAVFKFLLGRFLAATLYPTTASLSALGVADPQRAARAARRSAARRRLAIACAQPSVELLARYGLIEAPLTGE